MGGRAARRPACPSRAPLPFSPGIARAVGPHPPAAFFGEQAVLRVTAASFAFFASLAALTSGATGRGDAVDAHVQHGSWGLKLGAWVALVGGAFLLPVGALGPWAFVARPAAAAFLGVQVLLLLDCVCEVNDDWVASGDERALWGLLGLSGGAAAGVAAFAGVSLYFFNPAAAGDCSFNVTVIVATLLAGLAATALALSPRAPRGSLFPSAVVALYAAYGAFSALASEPRDYACNGLGRRADAASAAGVGGAVALAAASVLYAALRAGSATGLASLDPRRASDDSTPLLDRDLTSAGLDGIPGTRTLAPEREVVTADAPPAGAALAADRPPAAPLAYSYPWFHAVFAAGSAYIAMVLTGWGTGAAEREVRRREGREARGSGGARGAHRPHLPHLHPQLVDVGWPSVWVKLATAWAALGLYAWTLVAPTLFPDRFDF